MKLFDLIELLVLAAIWGASFLFMRVSAPEFGAFTLAWLRVLGAALFLMPLLVARQGSASWQALLTHWRPVMLIGLATSALPFVLYAFASLHLPAGLSSILNASTPMWGALVAWAWLAQKPNGWRSLGLVVGFGGVVWLVYAKTGLKGDAKMWAVLACLAATLSYAISGLAVKKWLSALPPLAVAAGSQASSAIWLVLPGVLMWPQVNPSRTAWGSLALLSIVCTGVAYILYFRLMARTGPTNAMTVTFLIPVFAILWGALFLNETLTLPMLGGGVMVLVGTGLALGLWPRARASG